MARIQLPVTKYLNLVFPITPRTPGVSVATDAGGRRGEGLREKDSDPPDHLNLDLAYPFDGLEGSFHLLDLAFGVGHDEVGD